MLHFLFKRFPAIYVKYLSRFPSHPVYFSILISYYSLTVRVIDLSGSQSIVDICLQETGGLGVHCVVDNGGIKKFFRAY